MACLAMMNVHAKKLFTKEDMLGKWLCKSTAMIKGIPESWAYSNVVIEAFDDGTAKNITMNKTGF